MLFHTEKSSCLLKLFQFSFVQGKINVWDIFAVMLIIALNGYVLILFVVGMHFTATHNSHAKTLKQISPVTRTSYGKWRIVANRRLRHGTYKME